MLISVMVQYHALGVLHQIRKSDKLAADLEKYEYSPKVEVKSKE